jgi:hypothetical protein
MKQKVLYAHMMLQGCSNPERHAQKNPAYNVFPSMVTGKARLTHEENTTQQFEHHAQKFVTQQSAQTIN